MLLGHFLALKRQKWAPIFFFGLCSAKLSPIHWMNPKKWNLRPFSPKRVSLSLDPPTCAAIPELWRLGCKAGGSSPALQVDRGLLGKSNETRSCRRNSRDSFFLSTHVHVSRCFAQPAWEMHYYWQQEGDSKYQLCMFWWMCLSGGVSGLCKYVRAAGESFHLNLRSLS